MIRENTFSATVGTALRTHHYSQTSSVVTWLTPDRGKVSTIVKGSFRPKSEFLGQHDLFYTCDLIYYNKDRNGLHVAKEFSPIKLRDGIRSSWRSAVLASYIACLICDTTQHDPHSGELFRLADTILDFVNEHDASMKILCWFELQFLGTLGVAPHLTNCSRCSEQFAPNKPVSFSVADGGLRCPKCAPAHHSGGRAPTPSTVLPDALAVLRNWQSGQSPRLAHNTKFSNVQIGEISALLKSFLDFHADFQHDAREIAVKLLNTTKKQRNKQ